MPRSMSARVMFWIGALLVIVGVLPGFLLDTAAITLWDPSVYASVYANEALGYVRRILGVVVLPLGIGLLAMSVVARHLQRSTNSKNGGTLPPRLTSRLVLWLGVALAVLGFTLEQSLESWRFNLSGNGGGILLDFLSYVALPLQPVIIPLGILLVPCSFLIASLEARAAEESGVRAHRTVNIIARPGDDGVEPRR